MSNRRDSYEARVAAWVIAVGPQFNLRRIEHIETDEVDCEACGRRQIHNLFTVNNTDGMEFTVGSECQALVLTSPEDLAQLPARHMRLRTIEELVMVGALYGRNISLKWSPAIAAGHVLKARKREAARRAWESRKANAVATP